MGKLPYGVPSRHVNASRGADTNLMKFYSTQNSTTYGQKFSNFQPRPGKHTGTGYLSNFRPGVYYSSHLDKLDNPVMGNIISDNYSSVTQKSFRPYEVGATGTEPLPSGTHQVGSGFVRQTPLTFPTKGQAQGAFIDTRIASAPANLMPRYQPHLHKIQGKDPVSSENCGYGPNYMSTETHEKFKGGQPDRSLAARGSVGAKDGSGFTHAYNQEPITFQPDSAHLADAPGWLTNRPTGVSIMKSHYRPTEFTKGDGNLPILANRSIRDTGFTSGTKALPAFVNRVMGDAYDKAGDVPPEVLNRIKKQDPVEFINMTNPNNYSSVAQNIYKGEQLPPQSEAGRLGRGAVGAKELSGFSENNDRYVHTSDNPARFVTHYMTKFVDKTPVGLDREGHTWGNVQRQKLDGYTKSTAVHNYGMDMDSTATLRNLDPYVGRSIKSRDTYFDDHTHDAKLRSSGNMIPAV